MSASLAEFLAGLEAAFPGTLEGAAPQLAVRHHACRMAIHVQAGPPLALGSLRLPTLDVTLNLSGGSQDEQNAMLAHLDRVTHRGGG